MKEDNPEVHLLARDIYNARAAANRPSAKLEIEASGSRGGSAEARTTGVTKSSTAVSADERLKSDLRGQLAKLKEEVEAKNKKISEQASTIAGLQTQIEMKNATIELKTAQITKFEMFVDMCNGRVMAQREKLDDAGLGLADGFADAVLNTGSGSRR